MWLFYSSQHRRTTLYLNTTFFQFRAQLSRILVMNRFHPQLSRILQVQWPVIDKHALLSGPLRHLQRDTEYQLLRLVVDRSDKIFPHPRYSIQHRARFGKLLGLREHECDELLARERPRPVKQRAVQVFIERDIS